MLVEGFFFFSSAFHGPEIAKNVSFSGNIMVNTVSKIYLINVLRYKKQKYKSDWFGLSIFLWGGISTFVGYLTPNLFLCK